MFGRKRSAESLTDEEKQKLIGMLWSLKASNFSTVLGALQVEGDEAQIITTNSSATAVFYRNAMAFGLAKEKPLEGVDWPEDIERPDVIVFQALDEARPMLLEMCYLSARTGAPPAAGVITKDCITILERYAEDNNAESQRKLGLLYDKGVCVAENAELAAKLYMAAAEQGDAPASNNLAMMYLTGRGVTQDFAQALKYFQKAADLGNVMAMDNLGETYNRGIGVAADVTAAFRLRVICVNLISGSVLRLLLVRMCSQP